jgi:hypothetical protein
LSERQAVQLGAQADGGHVGWFFKFHVFGVAAAYMSAITETLALFVSLVPRFISGEITVYRPAVDPFELLTPIRPSADAALTRKI